MEEIATNLARVKERIAQAAGKSGRSPDDIELVAGLTKNIGARRRYRPRLTPVRFFLAKAGMQEARAPKFRSAVAVALALYGASAEEQDPARTSAF